VVLAVVAARAALEHELEAGHALPPVARPARWPGAVRAKEERLPPV
jgi:hypothetical protein